MYQPIIHRLTKPQTYTRGFETVHSGWGKRAHRPSKWKQIAAEVDFTEALQGMGDDYSNLRLDLYNLPLNALALRPPKPAPPKNTKGRKKVGKGKQTYIITLLCGWG